MPSITLTVNGSARQVQTADDTPLLYVLRNDLGTHAARSSGAASRSAARAPSWWTARKCAPACSRPPTPSANRSPRSKGCPRAGRVSEGCPMPRRNGTLHPVQQAWIDEQVPHVRLLPERHDDQGDGTARGHARPDGRSDQERVHERAVAASLPLRHVLRDPRRRAARGHHHEGQVAMDIITNFHGATLSRRQFVKTGGALVVGFSLVGCRMLERPAKAAVAQELARRRAHHVVVRDPRRQHHPDADRQGGLRPVHRAHRLQADRRRGTERPLRGDHHGRDGRHGPDAGRRLLGRLSSSTAARISRRPQPIPIRPCSISRRPRCAWTRVSSR